MGKKENTANESSDSDFEIIEEKSSPKASPKPSDESPNNPSKSDRSRESTPKSENVICISDSPLSSETDNAIKKMVKKAKKKERKRKKREKREREKKLKNIAEDETWEEKKRKQSLT